MDIKDFKAGRFINTSGYQSFQPEKINHDYTWADREINLLLETATLRLGELNAFSELVPNIDHFIRMYVAKEATLSSKIEGTKTDMKEAMMKERDIQPAKINDWQEVRNYVEAMNTSIKKLPTLPLSSRLLKEAHKILLDGVRGKDKLPGEYRTSPNWIGGVTLNDAIYIPPVWQEVEPLMGDLENFLHNSDSGVPHVIRIGMAHYQFETIHPFLDGNGRIGRLMIPLYFVHHKVLKKHILYPSVFFEKHKTLYYDNLMRVRTHNSMTQWIKFFLTGIIETCDLSINCLKNIIDLKKDCEEKRIYKLGRKVEAGKKLFDHLLFRPIVDAEDVSKATKLSLVSSYNLISDFCRLKILQEMTGNKRNQTFIFGEYFSIFNVSKK